VARERLQVKYYPRVLQLNGVKCTIGDTGYLFDASYKNWSTTTGIEFALIYRSIDIDKDVPHQTNLNRI
jgi:hypothetical protein